MGIGIGSLKRTRHFDTNLFGRLRHLTQVFCGFAYMLESVLNQIRSFRPDITRRNPYKKFILLMSEFNKRFISLERSSRSKDTRQHRWRDNEGNATYFLDEGYVIFIITKDTLHEFSIGILLEKIHFLKCPLGLKDRRFKGNATLHV